MLAAHDLMTTSSVCVFEREMVVVPAGDGGGFLVFVFKTTQHLELLGLTSQNDTISVFNFL